MPPKTTIVRTVELAGAQRDQYETVRSAMQERVRAAIGEQGLARSHLSMLDALLKLRQVCCDPRLLKLDAAKRVCESHKLDLLLDMVPTLLDEGRRILGEVLAGGSGGIIRTAAVVVGLGVTKMGKGRIEKPSPCVVRASDATSCALRYLTLEEYRPLSQHERTYGREMSWMDHPLIV